jgi:hypothetical protein
VQPSPGPLQPSGENQCAKDNGAQSAHSCRLLSCPLARRLALRKNAGLLQDESPISPGGYSLLLTWHLAVKLQAISRTSKDGRTW